MSIQILLYDLVPSGVFKIISNFCGNSELNISIEKFDKRNLKNIKINNYNDVKINNIYIVKNIQYYEIYYRILPLFLTSPYLTISMIYNILPTITINIGFNSLNSKKNEMQDFYKYLILNKYKDFFHFMWNFEKTIHEKIIKNNNLSEFTFLPLIQSTQLFKKIEFDENQLEQNLKKINEKKIVIGYKYSIKIKLTPKTKYYRFNVNTNFFEKIKYEDIFQDNYHSFEANFVLKTNIITNDKKKIIVELIATQMCQIIQNNHIF